AVSRAVPILVLVALLVVSAVGIAVRNTTEAQQMVNRIIVADPIDQNPVVVRTVTELRQRGFVARTSLEVSEPASIATSQTVVFTATALQATPRSTLLSLYREGAVIAALDVSMPELLARIGITEPLTPVAPSPCHDCWLKPSPSYTLFSIVHSGNGYTRQTSDVLSSTGRFVVALERAENPEFSSSPSTAATLDLL
ncbi:MAG: hypothetical protein AB7U18_29370, partial [Dehalococcoidia bacterium]